MTGKKVIPLLFRITVVVVFWVFILLLSCALLLIIVDTYCLLLGKELILIACDSEFCEFLAIYTMKIYYVVLFLIKHIYWFVKFWVFQCWFLILLVKLFN